MQARFGYVVDVRLLRNIGGGVNHFAKYLLKVGFPVMFGSESSRKAERLPVVLVQSQVTGVLCPKRFRPPHGRAYPMIALAGSGVTGWRSPPPYLPPRPQIARSRWFGPDE